MRAISPGWRRPTRRFVRRSERSTPLTAPGVGTSETLATRGCRRNIGRILTVPRSDGTVGAGGESGLEARKKPVPVQPDEAQRLFVGLDRDRRGVRQVGHVLPVGGQGASPVD